MSHLVSVGNGTLAAWDVNASLIVDLGCAHVRRAAVTVSRVLCVKLCVNQSVDAAWPSFSQIPKTAQYDAIKIVRDYKKAKLSEEAAVGE